MVIHQFPSNDDDCAAAPVASATVNTAAIMPLMVFVLLLIRLRALATLSVRGDRDRDNLPNFGAVVDSSFKPGGQMAVGEPWGLRERENPGAICVSPHSVLNDSALIQALLDELGASRSRGT